MDLSDEEDNINLTNGVNLNVPIENTKSRKTSDVNVTIYFNNKIF